MARRRSLLLLWFALVSLLAVTGCDGCGHRVPHRDAATRAQLAAVSPALAAAVARMDSLVEAGPVEDDTARDHLQILGLQRQLRESADQDAIAAFLALWRARPGDIRLLETAWLRRRGFADRAAWDSLWSRGAGPDSTRASAVFAKARREWGYRPDAEQGFFALEDLADQLSPGERVFLQERLAQVEDRRGDCDAAVRRLLGLLPAAWRTGGDTHATVVWSSIANAYLHTSNLDHALVAADVAARCAERSGEPEPRMQATYLGARILENQERYAAAADSFTSAYRQAEALGMDASAGLAVGRLALLARTQGDLAGCLQHERKSLALVAARQDTAGMIKRLCAIAGTFRELGKLDSARVHLDLAVDLVARRNDVASLIVVDQARQLYALQLGDNEVADSLTRSLLARAEVQADPVLVRDLKLDLLGHDLESGRPDLAYRSLEHLRARGRITRESTDFDARLWLSLRAAELYARHGEYALAHAELDTVAQLTTRVTGATDRWLVAQTLGEVAAMMGDDATALSHFQAAEEVALTLGDPDKLRRTRIRHGRTLLDLGRAPEARTLFASSWHAPEYWTRFASALYTGMAYAAEGHHEDALSAYARADSLLAEGSPADLTNQLEVERARSLAALGRPRDAWRLLEDRQAITGGAATLERSEVLRAFHRDTERERAEVAIGLLFDHPELAPDGQATTLALRLDEQIRRPVAAAATSRDVSLAAAAIAAGSPVVRFFLGEQRGFAWVGTSDGWSMRELPDLPHLTRRVRDLVADMAQPGGEIAWDDARSLAAILLGDAAGAWRQDQPLWIAADGVLADLPWPALPLPDSPGLLIDRGPVVGVVAGIGSRTWPVGRAAPRVLALGIDSRRDGAQLHAAQREAGEVAARCPAGTCDLLLGSRGTWDAFRALPLATYDAIHVATHAEVSRGRQGGSTIRFGEAGHERPVTVEEVRALRLDGALIYLSCCSGARLAADTGSGLDSFAGACLQAGAGSVVASPLQVDDETSRLLAGRFYDRWLAGADPAAALRSAQLALRNGHDRRTHPFYWSFLRVLVADS